MHEMAKRQVVLLGETHTIAEIHRWQLHVATIIRFIRKNVAVGFEMFPRRVQPVLDEWVAGELSSQQFLEKVDWKNVWGYDPQLYLPLFHFCRQQRVPMLALNCNRPLVTRVGKDGWDAVPEEERDGLSPAAEATVAYREYLFGLGLNRVADSASIGDGSKTRSIYPRAADLGSRLCLQHCAGVGTARSRRWSSASSAEAISSTGTARRFNSAIWASRLMAVLLPAMGLLNDAVHINGIADAIFSLAEPDPASAP